MILTCTKCSGEGTIYASKHGGNDPDVWRVGACDECDGSGNAICEARGCKENAVVFNDDGEALCENCFSEWVIAEFEELFDA